ncbi:MAG: hypothetical protein SH819_02140, partial [Cytophagales bacterium]|nr:hypothetical protein [Cytophagales bacterium]
VPTRRDASMAWKRSSLRPVPITNGSYRGRYSPHPNQGWYEMHPGLIWVRGGVSQSPDMGELCPSPQGA